MYKSGRISRWLCLAAIPIALIACATAGNKGHEEARLATDGTAAKTEASVAEASESRAAPAAKFCWAASVEAEAANQSDSTTAHGASQWKRVVGLSLAPDGKKVWVASASGRFYIVDLSGNVLETWGKSGSGQGEFSFARGPSGMRASILFFPDGSFAIGDTYNSRIQLFDSERRYLGQWGSGDGVASSPLGLANRGGDEMLVAFEGRPELQRFGPGGDFRGMMDLGLRNPAAVGVDTDGRIWVVDCNYQDGARPEPPLVRVFEADGTPAFTCGGSEEGFTGLKLPSDIAFDGKGRVFVADSYHHRIAAFDRSGKYLFAFGNRGGGDGEFSYIRGLALDGEGSLYAGDWVGGRLLKFELPEAAAGPIASP